MKILSKRIAIDEFERKDSDPLTRYYSLSLGQVRVGRKHDHTPSQRKELMEVRVSDLALCVSEGECAHSIGEHCGAVYGVPDICKENE